MLKAIAEQQLQVPKMVLQTMRTKEYIIFSGGKCCFFQPFCLFRDHEAGGGRGPLPMETQTHRWLANGNTDSLHWLANDRRGEEIGYMQLN